VVEEGLTLVSWEPVLATGRREDDQGLPPIGGPERPAHPLRTVAELPLLAIVAIVLAFLLKTFLAQAFFIPSASMVPQLDVGDRVVVSKLSYRLHDPRRGDVVVFDSPLQPHIDQPPLPLRIVREVLEAAGVQRPGEEELIKRVVGLPGETVSCRRGRVTINGRFLVEPYLPEGTFTRCLGQGAKFPMRVPAGHVVVFGDNRGNSMDSRRFGPVDVDSVVGRAVVRVWPPQRIAFL
jgi:signal peptidase I